MFTQVWTARPDGPIAWLDGHVDADAVVIGAGFGGLVAALELARAGRKVALLEAQALGANGSGASAGHVGPLFYGARKTPAMVTGMLGEERARRLHSAVAQSGDFLFDLIAELNIACEARRGYVCLYRTEASFRRACSVFAQWVNFGGLFEPIRQPDLAEYIASDRYFAGIGLPQGGMVNPAQLLFGLADAARSNGVRIFEHSPVERLEAQGQGWTARCRSGSVTASQVLVACGSSTFAAWPELAGTSYRIGCGLAASARLADNGTNLLPRGGPVADMDDTALFAPAISADGRLLVSYLAPPGGSKARQVPNFVRSRLTQTFAGREIPGFISFSRGTVPLTPDGLPRLIDGGKGRLAITGCNGFGLTLGILAAREAVRHMLGADRDELALPLDPPRKLAAAGLVSAMLNAFALPLANRLGAR